jgi:hypothetical protein
MAVLAVLGATLLGIAALHVVDRVAPGESDAAACAGPVSVAIAPLGNVNGSGEPTGVTIGCGLPTNGVMTAAVVNPLAPTSTVDPISDDFPAVDVSPPLSNTASGPRSSSSSIYGLIGA